MNRVSNWFRLLGGHRYYVLAVIICFMIYAWAEITGRRILGDDVGERETHSATAGQHFYHK